MKKLSIINRLLDRSIIETSMNIFKKIYCRLFDYPNVINFEPASVCNLRCSMCWAFRASEGREKNFMTLSEFCRIIDETSLFCSSIFFNFCGEPLLNKEICDMIKYAKSKKIYVELSTNAILLDDKIIPAIIESGIDNLIISLDAVNLESYNSMRVGGDYQKVQENIKKLVEGKRMRKVTKPRLTLQMILSKQNRDFKDKFISTAETMNADIASIKSLYIDHQGGQDYVNKLKDEHFIDDVISRYNIVDGKFILKETGKCPNRRAPVVASDGNIHICCFDIYGKFKVGNAFREGFINVWKSEGYRKIRQDKMNKRAFPECAHCAYKNLPQEKYILNNREE